MENKIKKSHNIEDRNTNIEILRFILMLFICFWHVIMHGFDYKSIGSDDFSINTGTAIITFLCSLFSPSVYCFMFISGWYGIKYSQRKLSYLAFLGISCFSITLIIRFFVGEAISISYLLTHLFPVACYNWWFLTCYIMVFLLAPFIETGIKHLDRILLKNIIIILTYLEIFSIFTLSSNTGSSFYGLLYIYILARYLRLINYSPSFTIIFLTYIISFLSLWGICYGASILPGTSAKFSFLALSYNNPLIIIMAIAIFFMAKDFKPTHSKFLNNLFSNVFTIYLITEGVGTVLYKFQASIIKENIIIGSLIVILSAVLCLIIGIFLKQIYHIYE